MLSSKSYLLKPKLISQATLLALGSAFLSAGIKAAPPESAGWKQGQILVKPRAGLPAQEFDKILKGHGGKSNGKLRNLDVHTVNVPLNAEDAVVKALSRNPHVKFAEKDLLIESTVIIPDDPEYGSAWHLPKIEVGTAWETATADGITIAILDSGVDASHPDLAGQLVPGWNTVSNNSDTSPVAGHGTWVAGAAAAATNNGIGVAGVAWKAKIMPLRISNDSDGSAYISDIAEAVAWAADHGADVANISYNISSSSTVANAAQRMRSMGGVVVAAAGNNGSDSGWSDKASIIAVSATTSSDAKASYSNYGNYIDVSAPGSGIRTTNTGGGYASATGTSFASPVTAGVVALIMGANPNLSPDDVEAILEASADDLVSGSDWHAYFGHGRVNAANAVQMAVNTTAVDYQPPAVTIFSPSSGSTATGLVTVDVNASDNNGVTEVSLYADNQLVGTASSAPYQFSWDSTQSPEGGATLTAYAQDSAGNEGASGDVDLLVDNVPDPVDNEAPVVDISNPSNGATVSRTVRVNVGASDNVSVASVRLYINGQLKSSATSGSLSYDWNTRKVSSGSHTIRAEALDAAGNPTSQSIQVNVGGSSTGGGKGKKNR